MPLNHSRLAYSDCYDILDQAVAAPKGIRIKMLNEGALKKLRARLFYARTIDRADNRENFPLDHFMHGKSTYDTLTTETEQTAKGLYLKVLPVAQTEFHIEEIPDEQGSHDGDNREAQGEGEGEGGPVPEEAEASSQASAEASAIRRI